MQFISSLPALLAFWSISALLGSVDAFAAPAKVNVGSCKPYAVVAGATVTNSGHTVVNGDLALFPGTAVTGFPAGQVVGTMQLTNGLASACINDLALAITDAKARAPNQQMTGELGGSTLFPGVYKSSGGYAITNILYLDGQDDPDAAWIFIMATTLVANTGSQVIMQHYDVSQGINVWWTCGTRADILTNAAMQGTVMASASIAVGTGATTGPLMANLGQVTLLRNTVNSYMFGQYAKPTSHPSSRPSAVPTSKPSRTATPTVRVTTEAQLGYIVTLAVEQRFNGISIEQYYEQQAAHNRTIQHAVAGSIHGVAPEDVTDITVADASDKKRRLAQDDSILVSYHVTSHDPTFRYEDLSAQLIAAEDSGAMQTAINENAELYGADALKNAEVAAPLVENALSAYPTSQPSAQPSSLPTRTGAPTFSPPPYVDLGTCKPFAVVAGATVTNSGPSVLTGDLALSPGSAVVGFPPGKVIGTMHKTNGAAAACIGNLATAITNANGRPADVLMVGELGGMTLYPAVYKSSGGYSISTILTLDGRDHPQAAWIFIMATTLAVNTNAQVIMINYDFSKGTNVWWSCGARADIYVGATLQGTVMAYASIGAMTNAKTGPLMAWIGQVTLMSNEINSYQSQIPEPVPSAKPSAKPTANPTTKEESKGKVTLEVEQMVTGVSANQYNANQNANDLTIQHALSSSVDGVAPSDVTDISATGPSNGRRLRLAAAPGAAGATNACLMAYKMTSYDPKMTYEKLAAQLIQAAVTGDLMDAIREYANIYGSDDLLDVSFGKPMVENGNSNSNSDKAADELSDGAIAGIAIGCFFGLLILGFIVWVTCAIVYPPKHAHEAVPAKEGIEVQMDSVATV